MKTRILLASTAFFLLFLICFSFAGQPQKVIPETGIYDGKIKGHKIILVVENADSLSANGYFVYNRNKAVEPSNKFSIISEGRKQKFVSDAISGALKLTAIGDEFKGKLTMPEKSIFFWRNKSHVVFNRRSIYKPEFFPRYQEEIFTEFLLEKDIVYGTADGYWTETPYLDEPYIETLAKGMVNTFKGEKPLPLKMDIYRPTNDALQQRPLILIIHGGGFYVGNKQSVTERLLASKFCKLGYVVASIDYRLGFRLNSDEVERSGYKALQDAHAALRFLSSNANQYGIDPDQVYVTGTSAGAIASLNIAFMKNDERPESTYELHNIFQVKTYDNLGPIDKSGNKLSNKFTIKAVGNMWGALSNIDILDKEEHIPVISFHGNEDIIVPFDYDYPFQYTFMLNRLVMDKMYGSQIIHKQLNKFGIENKLVVLDGMGHEPQLETSDKVNDTYYTIEKALIDFFYKQTAPKIELDKNDLYLNEDSALKNLKIDADRGKVISIETIGGLKVSDKNDESKIIWLKDASDHQLIIYSTNDFDAWNKTELSVSVE